MQYALLTKYYDKISQTSKRLEKIKHISELLQETDRYDLEMVIFLLQGRVFPKGDEQKIGMASRLVIKALSTSSGVSTEDIEKEWKNTGDIGKSTQHLIQKKKQATLFSEPLSVSKVFENLVKLAKLEGAGTVNNKVQLLCELLTSATPREARYIVRTVIGDLRVGASEGTLRDAIVRAYFTKTYENREVDEESKKEYTKKVQKVQHAFDLSNDFGKVVKKLEESGEKGLESISLELFNPLNPMLFPKAKDIEDGFSIVGKPAIIEYKYDGFRVQIHKDGEKVELFTRRLENVTDQFPDIIDVIRKNVKANRCILDSEVLGVDRSTGTYMPFQNISQRIRRKHGIDDMAKKVPVINIIFDILYLNDDSLLQTQFEKRREILEDNIDIKEGKIEFSKMLKTDNTEKANSFYEKSLLLGNEGIMMKSLDKGYKPGARIGYGVKVKPVLEPLDLAIIGAEWGHGKRAGWLTSFTVACKSNSGEMLKMGKVGTGVKELDQKEAENKTFKQFTDMLKPLVTKETNSSVEVKPEIIVEIDYEEIQKSINYDSGYALRFPRIKRIRDDLSEPSCIEDVRRVYQEQRGREQ